MSYRIIVKPLTEKTENKAKYGELIVNTESGHISVQNSTERISATKNIETELELKQLLFTNIITLLDSFDSRLVSTQALYTDSDAGLSNISNSVQLLRTRIATIYADVTTMTTNAKSTVSGLIEYYNIIWVLVQDYSKFEHKVIEYERITAEVRYIVTVIAPLDSNMRNESAEVVTKRDSVKANVNTRVDKSIFDSWKSGLIGKYINLKGNYSAIESITFKYNE